MQVYVCVPDNVAVSMIELDVFVFTPDVISVPEQVQVVGSPFLRSIGTHNADAVGLVVSMINVWFSDQSSLPVESLQ